MKQTVESVASGVEHPNEIGPITGDYLGEDTTAQPQQSVADSLWLLWDRRRLLWRSTILGFLIFTLIAFLIPPRYESTSRIMPPEPQAGSGLAMVAALVGKGNLGLSSLAGDLVGMKSTGALFTAILRSRTVEDRLVERFDLRKVYRDKYWQDARRDLNNYTDITEDRKSGVILIAVTDRDSHRAAQIAQGYVEELDRLVAQVSTSSARRERMFIEQRLTGVKQDLDNTSKQFSEYASQNTAVDIQAQAKATVEAAARLEGELIAAQSELEGLEQIYTTNNVRVRSLRARVEELKRQLHKLGGDDTTSTSSDPNAQPEFPSVRKLPLLGVRWVDLFRQTKIQETVYELLTQQYEVAKIQEAKEIPTVKVLDAANVPEKKSSPHRLLIMGFGGFVSLFVSVSWILGMERWHRADSRSPMKQLGDEILEKVKTTSGRWLSLVRTSRNGTSV